MPLRTKNTHGNKWTIVGVSDPAAGLRMSNLATPPAQRVDLDGYSEFLHGNHFVEYEGLCKYREGGNNVCDSGRHWASRVLYVLRSKGYPRSTTATHLRELLVREGASFF